MSARPYINHSGTKSTDALKKVWTITCVRKVMDNCWSDKIFRRERDRDVAAKMFLNLLQCFQLWSHREALQIIVGFRHSNSVLYSRR